MKKNEILKAVALQSINEEFYSYTVQSEEIYRIRKNIRLFKMHDSILSETVDYYKCRNFQKIVDMRYDHQETLASRNTAVYAAVSEILHLNRMAKEKFGQGFLARYYKINDIKIHQLDIDEFRYLIDDYEQLLDELLEMEAE